LTKGAERPGTRLVGILTSPFYGFDPFFEEEHNQKKALFMMINTRGVICGICGLFALGLCGCVLPSFQSWESNVYARTGENGQTNEVVIEKTSEFGWYALGPDGGDLLGRWKIKRRYYSKKNKGRRKSMPFLLRKSVGCVDTWTSIAPVEGTNVWVRVEGSDFKETDHTNLMVITVFTSKRLLYQQNVVMQERNSWTNHLRFDEGNRFVTYESTNDAFVYSVLDNTLKK
jgi:hypothetical protein